ncbi:sensor histidine kinase [Paenibacillus methanolicus]|uniref:histidine kinase n=1 Tax=Paenibacillus methanolicus TaxID=582686 RepID=A0A5S5CJ60_9BACL|nr:HAMP domain-containing sensor histidine kinase [Paenibacillus methanolicus]TYP78236.1 two-component system sporulation sensor kinase B [Paenibacillus methanolicus]
MNVIKDFLLQVALIAMPVFGHQMPWEKNKKAIMTVLWGIALVACMTFPVGYGMQFRLDIRIIPLLLGFLYGGIGTGLSLTALLLLFRLYLGLDVGFYTTMLTALCGIPPMVLFRQAFLKGDLRRRMLIACSLAGFYCLMGIGWSALLRGFALDNLKVQAVQLLCVLLTTWVAVRLNDFVHEVQFVRMEAERLRTISALTSLFAHEIRNPMQATRGFLQLLDDPSLSEKKKQYIRLSIGELDRANAIIGDYLSFGKPASAQTSIAELAHELNRAANVMQPYVANQGVSIRTLAYPACKASVNPQQFGQLVINLLKNAIESMPEGGEIELSCMPDGDSAVIRVKDEGVGMTPEQLERIGSPFYSLKESGTGLGMIVCYQIVKQFGGKMTVESEYGSGTDVTVRLPLIEEEKRIE